MKKTRAYIRSNIKDDKSVEIQSKRLAELCKEKNLEIDKEYIDNGYPGTNLDRPSLQEMLKDAVDEKFNILLVDGAYRLSRVAKDFLYIYQVLKDNNITLISIENGIHAIELEHSDVISDVKLSEIIEKEIKEQISKELDKKARSC